MTASGLPVVSARLLDGRGGCSHLDREAFLNWRPEDGPRWVDLDLNDRESRRWAEEVAGVDETVVDTLLAVETRPRVAATPTGLLVVVRGVNLNPGADPEDMVATRIWLDRHQVITSRRRPVLSVEDIGKALDEGRGPDTVGEFLVYLVARLTDRIGTVVEGIEDTIDDFEECIERDEIADLRERLGYLRRQIAGIRRFLSPQRDALDRLYRHPGEFLAEGYAQELREETDRLTRCLEDLDLAREEALVTQEELLNRVAQEQNQRVYLLSVVAAIFLPLTFVTGLLGMNVAGLPGTESPLAFVVSLVMMFALGVGLTLFFKWRSWI